MFINNGWEYARKYSTRVILHPKTGACFGFRDDLIKMTFAHSILNQSQVKEMRKFITQDNPCLALDYLLSIEKGGENLNGVLCSRTIETYTPINKKKSHERKV